uniref:Uncharacterized protein n=1 Tax=Anguilla anguilla TaxID=7936 RepID=A0A0E9WUU5_ANGAN
MSAIYLAIFTAGFYLCKQRSSYLQNPRTNQQIVLIPSILFTCPASSAADHTVLLWPYGKCRHWHNPSYLTTFQKGGMVLSLPVEVAFSSVPQQSFYGWGPI